MSGDENQLLKDKALWRVQASLFDPKTFVSFGHKRKEV